MTDQPLLGRADAVPRRRWRWLLPLVIGVSAVALVVSLVVRDREQDKESPRFALDTYLEALETNATIKAYGLLCRDKRPSRHDFEEQVAKERQDSGGVVGHKISDVTKRSNTIVVATYTVNYKHTYKWWAAALVKDAQGWKVCGFKIIPRPELRLPADQIPTPPGFDDTGASSTTR